MSIKSTLTLLCSLLAAAAGAYGADEGTLSRDGFVAIVARVDDEEARAFFSVLRTAGERYTFPVVWDAGDLTGDDLWIAVDGEKYAVKRPHLVAFYRAMTSAGVTLSAGGKKMKYELGKKPSEAGGKPARGVTQTEPAKNEPSGNRAGTKKPADKAEGASGPAYRLSCNYGDVVLSSDDAGKIFPDTAVAGIVDELQFKNFPYNKDGDAQKLFRENQKKMEGLMSSASGRKKVLRTYAYYDTKDQSWKADLLEDILAHYKLGKITKE